MGSFKPTLVVFLAGLLMVCSAHDLSQISDCVALCQIHEVHVVWEQEEGGSRDLKKREKDSGGRFFTCRTLWDQSIENDSGSSRKYLPLHEIRIESSVVRRYDARSLEDGEWSLCFEGGSPKDSGVSSDHIIPTEQALNFAMSRGFDKAAKRRLSGAPSDPNHRRGEKNILVVRIRTLIGDQPTATKSRLEQAIFGPIENSNAIRLVSVADQYKLISHGSLQYYPATFPSQGVTTGVMDVFFSSFNGESIQFLANDLVDATERALGIGDKKQLSDLVHHTVFCLPDEANAPLNGNNFDWTAFTYRYEPYSYYRLNRCSKLSIVAHELGHASLGFRHSGAYVKVPDDSEGVNGGTRTINGVEYQENEYADETGYMGYSVNAFGVPQKAMNAHKHWLSRWYNGHSMLSLDPLGETSHHQVELVGYSQYNADHWTQSVAAHRNKAVLLRLGDLYVQYNYVSSNTANDWNRHTAYPNKLTIVRAGSDNSISFLVSVLEPGLAYIGRDYQNSGKTVVVAVCPKQTTGSKASPSVHLIIYQSQQGKDPPQCRVDTPAPSPSPIDQWSPPPTISPTFAPVQTPSPVANTPVPTEKLIIEREEPDEKDPVGKGPVVSIEVPTDSSSWLSLSSEFVIATAASVIGLAVLLLTFLLCGCCVVKSRRSKGGDGVAGTKQPNNQKELATKEAEISGGTRSTSGSVRRPPTLATRSSTASTDPLADSDYV